MAEAGARITRVYGGFRGVDFRGEDINLVRSPDACNVWRDYREIESIRTRPGLRYRTYFDAVVRGIYFYGDEQIIHAGTKLYRITDGDQVEIFSGCADAPSDSFIYENVFYFKDGKNYLQYDGTTCKPVEGYIPTTTIARKPMGGGTKHQGVNMLSDYRRNSFLADGGSFDFFLDVTNIDTDYVPEVTVDGKAVAVSDYTVNYEDGVISFVDAAPNAPQTDGQDNVVVTFKKAVEKYKRSILGCTLLQVFDNRVFFSGNPDYPNYLWHCRLDDPTYCSDLDYYREGMDTADLRGMVAGNNALWVFRSPSTANTTVFYHTPTIDEEYGKIYPSVHSSVTTGCVGRAINFGDDIVFFSERGMEGISGDVTTEQVVAHRSSLVDRLLTAEQDYADMILCEWEGYLLVFVGDHAYLADSRGMFQNDNHMEYEWFYWDIGMTVTAARVHNGVLYVGTNDKNLYTLDDHAADVVSWWVTPKDKIGQPQRLKTTNKRGCVAEATGDITVYAKLEDTDFERIGEYNDITDYFVSRIKRKKFKDIQLMFYSETRFSLESVTLECFIGGYIKR